VGAALATPDVTAPVVAGDQGASGNLGPAAGPDLLGLVVLMVGLAGAGSVLFVVFGRRRRGEPSAAELAMEPAPSLPSERTSVSPAALAEEAHIPRWLRASVRAERAWTPPREPTVRTTRRHALAFDEPVGPEAMRLVIRYDGVDILDQRNEAYARTLAQLGTGDEVEILELDEPWAFVRTPHGVEGWLPTMAIGVTPAASSPIEVPVAAGEPVAAEAPAAPKALELAPTLPPLAPMLPPRPPGRPTRRTRAPRPST
jgi:hypothetical protein